MLITFMFMIYCLGIQVEGGNLTAQDKMVKMTLQSNSGDTYTITRHQGGGSVFAD